MVVRGVRMGRFFNPELLTNDKDQEFRSEYQIEDHEYFIDFLSCLRHKKMFFNSGYFLQKLKQNIFFQLFDLICLFRQ